jgi:hypothetical protein
MSAEEEVRPLENDRRGLAQERLMYLRIGPLCMAASAACVSATRVG